MSATTLPTSILITEGSAQGVIDCYSSSSTYNVRTNAYSRDRNQNFNDYKVISFSKYVQCNKARVGDIVFKNEIGVGPYYFILNVNGDVLVYRYLESKDWYYDQKWLNSGYISTIKRKVAGTEREYRLTYTFKGDSRDIYFHGTPGIVFENGTANKVINATITQKVRVSNLPGEKYNYDLSAPTYDVSTLALEKVSKSMYSKYCGYINLHKLPPTYTSSDSIERRYPTEAKEIAYFYGDLLGFERTFYSLPTNSFKYSCWYYYDPNKPPFVFQSVESVYTKTNLDVSFLEGYYSFLYRDIKSFEANTKQQRPGQTTWGDGQSPFPPTLGNCTIDSNAKVKCFLDRKFTYKATRDPVVYTQYTLSQFNYLKTNSSIYNFGVNDGLKKYTYTNAYGEERVIIKDPTAPSNSYILYKRLFGKRVYYYTYKFTMGGNLMLPPTYMNMYNAMYQTIQGVAAEQYANNWYPLLLDGYGYYKFMSTDGNIYRYGITFKETEVPLGGANPVEYLPNNVQRKCPIWPQVLPPA